MDKQSPQEAESNRGHTFGAIVQRRRIVGWLGMIAVVLILGALFVEVVDAQRRRRRRRRRPRPQPTTQVVDAGVLPQSLDAGVDTTGSSEGESLGPEGVPSGEGSAFNASDMEAPASSRESTTDLTEVRAEYDQVMDDLVRARSRIAVVGNQLFRTKVRVLVHNRASGEQNLHRLKFELDRAPIFQARTPGGLSDKRRVFEGFAAPGPHTLTVDFEQHARSNDNYRYSQQDTYRFRVMKGKLTEVTVVIDDDSDIAEDFDDDGEGEYDVRTRVRVATRELGAR